MSTTKPLTTRQQTVLQTLLYSSGRTRQWLGVRSDVLWRLEERGLVSRNSNPEPRWSLTQAGREAVAGGEA